MCARFLLGARQVNWSPYVATRRFQRVGCDEEGYVTRVLLDESGLRMDLSDLGVLLGPRLVELGLYYNEHLSGHLSLLAASPGLEVWA